MITIVPLIALLGITPAYSNSPSGFCAAIVNGTAYITLPKDTPSKESIEHDFRTRLFRTDKFASLTGCIVAESADVASEMMRKKALEISKEGYEIELLGW